MSLLVIDDHNYKDVAQQYTEYGRGLEPDETNPIPEGAYGTDFPDWMLIPRNEWKDRIDHIRETQQTFKELVAYYNHPIKNQSRTYLCWAFGTTYAVELCRLHQDGISLSLSPASIAGPITGWRNRGGWGSEAIAYGIEHGWVPSADWPDTSLDRRKYYTDANNNQRQNHRVYEWIRCERGNFDQQMSLLLHRKAAASAHPWWGHLVCAADPYYDRNGFGWGGFNSWGERWGDKGYFILMEGKATASEFIAPLTVTHL